MPIVTHTGSFSIAFQNEMIIYEQNVICHVKDNEFNLSYNPTLLQDNLFIRACMSQNISVSDWKKYTFFKKSKNKSKNFLLKKK